MYVDCGKSGCKYIWYFGLCIQSYMFLSLYRVILTLTPSPPPFLVQYQNDKRPTSQPEALLNEEYHETAALVGSLAFFDFGIEEREGGGRQLKNHSL